MSRKRAKDMDYLRVYPGLNDFSDALEAVPLEMVRHFTLLKEIDAKCTVTAPQLAQAIVEFMAKGKKAEGREQSLDHIRTLLQELMPCLEEKMHVASMAADTMTRHLERVDADYQLIVDHEIPKIIQIDPDNPAVSDEIRPVDKPTASRSEARREAIAAKKAAAAAAAAAASESQASRQSTPAAAPVNHATNGSTATAGGPAKAGRTKSRNGVATFNAPTNGNAPTFNNTYDRGTAAKRRREEDEEEEEEAPPTVTPSRRRRNPADKDEPVYCYCEQGSYGDMVGCDGPDCKREWFHLGCIGLSATPKGQWFCEECQAKSRTRR